MPVSHLGNMRKEQDETLKSYLERFNVELPKVAYILEELI